MDVRSYTVKHLQDSGTTQCRKREVQLNRVIVDSAATGHKYNQYQVLLNVANAFSLPFRCIEQRWSEFSFTLIDP